MKIEVWQEAWDFITRLAPEPRRHIKLALKNLAKNQGDTKLLEGEFLGLCRLRVRGYRVIYQIVSKNLIQCIFIEHRALVYELLGAEIENQLLGRDSDL